MLFKSSLSEQQMVCIVVVHFMCQCISEHLSEVKGGSGPLNFKFSVEHRGKSLTVA